MTVDESEQIPAVLDCQAEQSLRMGAGTLLQLDRGDNDHCCHHPHFRQWGPWHDIRYLGISNMSCPGEATSPNA